MSSIKNKSTAAPSGADPTEISLEELAVIFAGSGMVGYPIPKPRKPTSGSGTSSGGGSSSANSAPYSPPLVIPNIPSEPSYAPMFDPSPTFWGDGGGGY